MSNSCDSSFSTESGISSLWTQTLDYTRKHAASRINEIKANLTYLLTGKLSVNMFDQRIEQILGKPIPDELLDLVKEELRNLHDELSSQTSSSQTESSAASSIGNASKSFSTPTKGNNNNSNNKSASVTELPDLTRQKAELMCSKIAAKDEIVEDEDNVNIKNELLTRNIWTCRCTDREPKKFVSFATLRVHVRSCLRLDLPEAIPSKVKDAMMNPDTTPGKLMNMWRSEQVAVRNRLAAAVSNKENNSSLLLSSSSSHQQQMLMTPAVADAKRKRTDMPAGGHPGGGLGYGGLGPNHSWMGGPTSGGAGRFGVGSVHQTPSSMNNPQHHPQRHPYPGYYTPGSTPTIGNRHQNSAQRLMNNNSHQPQNIHSNQQQQQQNQAAAAPGAHGSHIPEEFSGIVVKGLIQHLKEQDSRILALEKENTTLKSKNDKLDCENAKLKRENANQKQVIATTRKRGDVRYKVPMC